MKSFLLEILGYVILACGMSMIYLYSNFMTALGVLLVVVYIFYMYILSQKNIKG